VETEVMKILKPIKINVFPFTSTAEAIYLVFCVREINHSSKEITEVEKN
jgi:hypothetical protein